MTDLDELLQDVLSEPDFVAAEIFADNIAYFAKSAKEYFVMCDKEPIADGETSYCLQLLHAKTAVAASQLVFLANAIFRQISTATPEALAKLSYLAPSALPKYATTILELSSRLGFISIGVESEDVKQAIDSLSEITHGLRSHFLTMPSH